MATSARIKRIWERAFHERQLHIRSRGKVRFVSVKAPVQVALALASILIAGGSVYSLSLNIQSSRAVDQLETRVRKITAAYDHLSQNMATVRDRYGSVSGDMERSRGRLDEMQRERAVLYERLAVLTDSLDRANKELGRSTEDRNNLNKRLAEMRTQLQSTEGERGRLVSNLNNLASELERTAQQRDEERQQRERLAQSMVSLRQHLATVETTRASLQSAVAERDQMLSHLAEERDGAERRQHQLSQLVTDLHQQMSAVEGARMELESIMGGQSGQMAQLRQERDEAVGSNQRLTRRVAGLEERITEVQGVQQDILQRVRQRTDASIKKLEAVVAMTGLKLAPLLDRADGDGTGIGGPLVSARKLINGDLSEPAEADAVESALAHLESRLNRWTAMHQILAHLPIVAPVNHYRVSSSFGRRSDPYTKKSAFHSGVDLAGAKNTRIYSTSPGTVTYAGRRGPYGRMVEIDHGFGLKTRYGHLARVLVKKGAKVGHREKIGLMGSTGRSTGVHVHYEVLFDGKPLNPMKFLEAGRHVFKQG